MNNVSKKNRIYRTEEVVAVILAGGKGVRMKADMPKVLHMLKGKELILHVLDSLQKAGVERNIVVVGYKGEDVISALNGRADTAWQHEQLGTGHAVMQAEKNLEDFEGKVIVACGDVPLVSPETFKQLVKDSCEDKVKAVVLTMEARDPFGYGRIVKDDKGAFLRIVEEKDAQDDEKAIKEVNTGIYVFDKDFLFDGLKRIDTNNAQNEYYLPDVLNYVIDSGYKVGTRCLENALEGTGINTSEELKKLENYIDNN